MKRIVPIPLMEEPDFKMSNLHFISSNIVKLYSHALRYSGALPGVSFWNVFKYFPNGRDADSVDIEKGGCCCPRAGAEMMTIGQLPLYRLIEIIDNNLLFEFYFGGTLADEIDTLINVSRWDAPEAVRGSRKERITAYLSQIDWRAVHKALPYPEPCFFKAIDGAVLTKFFYALPQYMSEPLGKKDNDFRKLYLEPTIVKETQDE